MSSQTTVSLPDHLRSALQPLLDILPEDLRARLSPHIAETSSEIPHLLLSDIAKWARTDEACTQLRTQNLEPSQYTIIALLAGTITSPSSKLPPYVPPDDAAGISKRAADDRRAITAIINALLSIGCAGYAAWWASSHAGWQEEWRVLFALLVASVLAVTESVLYLIWQSRKEASRRRRPQHRIVRTRKKLDGSDQDTRNDDREDDQDSDNIASGLRKRKARTADG